MPRLHSRTGQAIALAAPALALLHAIAPLPAGAQVTLQGQIDAFAGFSRPLGADKGTRQAACRRISGPCAERRTWVLD